MEKGEKIMSLASSAMQTAEALESWEYTRSAQSVVLVAHRSPDGDAVGAVLALWNHMQESGVQAHVVLPDGFPGFLNWMPGAGKIIFHDSHPERAERMVSQADVLWCLDFNGPSRVGGLEDAVRKNKGRRIVVDHHLEPEDFAEILLSDPQCGSTCELIYGLMETWGHAPRISKETAACIYTGIMTDTGSFRFSSVTHKTHGVLAALIERGLDHAQIHERVYDNNRLERIQLTGYAMSSKLKLWPEFHAALIYLDQAELRRFDYKSGDSEGLVNQALSIAGIVFAVYMHEADDGRIKMSMRSRGDFSVRDIASEHFNGGGHRNAAGGAVLDATLEEVVARFEALLPLWEDDLKATYAAE